MFTLFSFHLVLKQTFFCLSLCCERTAGQLANSLAFGQSLFQHTLKHRHYRCLLLYLGFQESNSERLSLQAVFLLSHLPRLLKNRSHSIASLKPVTTLFQPLSNGVTGASHNAWQFPNTLLTCLTYSQRILMFSFLFKLFVSFAKASESYCSQLNLEVFNCF